MFNSKYVFNPGPFSRQLCLVYQGLRFFWLLLVNSVLILQSQIPMKMNFMACMGGELQKSPPEFEPMTEVWHHPWKKKMEFRKRLSFWENSHFLGKSPYLQRKLIFQTIIFWGTPLVFQGAKFLTWPLSKLPFLFGEFCKFSKSKLANFNDSGSVIEKFHNLKNKKKHVQLLQLQLPSGKLT